MIDPLDIEMMGLNSNELLKSKKFIFLNDAYFDDEESIENKTDLKLNSDLIYKNKNSKRPCLLPKLNPYDTEIMQFVKKEEEIKCNPKKIGFTSKMEP